MSEQIGILNGYSCLVGGALPKWEGKAIILVDLDAFFASVEQLDHPEWRGKPVIVGGSSDKRGVVSTCSYEARKFGVHSAMPSWQAERLCPNAIWTHGNYPRYTEMSRKVMAIINDETPTLQQVSIDEAFADVTPGRFLGDHPVDIARRIRARVAELGITCSIGLGTSKSVAKIASEANKPDGLTAIFPGEEREFLNPLPVGSISGIGARSREKLEMYGIKTIGELADCDEPFLRLIFGSTWEVMLHRARGEEDGAVQIARETKSVSNEQTFSKDLTEREEILAAIDMLAAKVGRRLRRKGLKGHTVTVKVKYSRQESHTAQRTLDFELDDEHVMVPYLHELVDEVWAPGISVRLLGVGVSGFEEDRGEQLSLFDAVSDDGELELAEEGSKASHVTDGMLARATDKVKDRFGEQAVIYGREIRFSGRDTGTIAQNKFEASLGTDDED
ncbi:MAG: DNA polymerase IV [Coriobacteriales bacterium]|nr:DNA polymerase IV [Coriobacteriales bacterium]